MCCIMCVFVIQFSLTIKHMNLLGQCRYLIFLGESEASKKMYMLHLELKHFGDSVLSNIGYVILGTCIYLTNIFRWSTII